MGNGSSNFVLLLACVSCSAVDFAASELCSIARSYIQNLSFFFVTVQNLSFVSTIACF